MRVFMGIARGLCDDGLLSFVKMYIDTCRLSYYSSHSDQGIDGNPGTLQYFEIAIDEFFSDL